MKKLATRLISITICLVMVATLVPSGVFAIHASDPEKQVWLYVPEGSYDTVDAAMDAMHQHTDSYDTVASLQADGTGVKITRYTDTSVDVYPGFSDSKLTDEIPSYDVGHTEYSFYGWQKMISDQGTLTGSDSYATYGSTLDLPDGTVVYAAVYLKRPKTYALEFKQADGTLIPELSDALAYDTPVEEAMPTPEEIAEYVANLTGYRFTFWADTPWEKGTVHDDAIDFFAPGKTMKDEAVTLWAHYDPLTMTVTYEVRDPVTGEIISTEDRTVTYDQPLDYDAASDSNTNMPAEPTLDGYTFTGWVDSEGKEYAPSTPVTFIEDITLGAVFTPDDGQIWRARVWYEQEDGAYVDSGLTYDFTGVTHTEIAFTAHQRDLLRGLLDNPDSYVWDHEDTGVIITPCMDPENGDPAEVNVYFRRKTFGLTVNADGGSLTVNGTPDADGVYTLPVYAGTALKADDNMLTVKGADGQSYTFKVTRNAYAYRWENIPAVMDARDMTVTVTGIRLDVNITIKVHVQDLAIENDAGTVTTYTQHDLDALNRAYAEAYERAAIRLSNNLGYAVSVDELRVSDLADETYKTYAAVVNEELAKVNVGYDGRAVDVYAADSYSRLRTFTGFADAGTEIKVETVTVKGTTQYHISWVSVDGTVHTLTDRLYILDENELGFSAATAEGFTVTVADDGSTEVALYYDRNTYRFIPSVFFGDGGNATEKFEGIPGVSYWQTVYGAPLQALTQMHIGDAHEALDRFGVGHVGYLLDEFSTLYALHCKNTGALADTYTWPAREYGLVIGEYVIQSYTLTVHYRDAAGEAVTRPFTVAYNTPLSTVLTEELASELALVGYDILGYAYDAEGSAFVLPADTMPAEALEVYVIDTPVEIVLSFDPAADDASAPAPSDTVTAYFDSPVGSLPVTERPGYIFDGWYYTTPDGDLFPVTADTVVDAAMLSAAGDDKTLELVALWREGPTTFEIRFLYQTLDGGYLMDDTATLTDVPGTTGQSALSAALAAYPSIFADYLKPGFAEAARDGETVLAGDGSTVLEIRYDRMTYHITVYANGTAPGSEGYAYGATVNGEKQTTVSFVYGSDLSGYMQTITPAAAGYSVASWTGIDWEGVLAHADETNTVTAPLAYPIWTTVKAIHTIDPTSGMVRVTVNGEQYGTVMYNYQNAYLPIGAEITLTAVAPDVTPTGGRLAFLGWFDLRDNTLVSHENSVTFTADAEGVAYKAVYVYLADGVTYTVYLNKINRELLWFGNLSFDELDSATRTAFVAAANRFAQPDGTDSFDESDGFTVIHEADGVIWYETNNR